MEENKISLMTAILININIMIGAGIFIVPPIMAKLSGPLSFLGWTAVGIIFLPVVLSIAKITSFFPKEGNFYIYGKSVINKTTGFLSSWMYFLGFSSIAALQILGIKELLIENGGLTIIKQNPILFNIFFILFFSILNFLSLKILSKVQNSLTIFKSLPLIFVIILIIFYFNPQLQFGFSNIGLIKFSIPLALFGFWGFESSCNISHLIKGGQKNVYKAILISFSATIFLYTLFHLGLIYIMGTENLINYNVPGFVEFLGIKSEFLLNLLNAIIPTTMIIALMGSTFGGFLSNSTNLHTMTKENLFPFSKFLQKTNKSERPIFCVISMAITTFIFITLINSKEILNSMINFGLLTTFMITFASLLILLLRKKMYKQIIIPILAFASSIFVIYYSWVMIAPDQLTRLKYSLPLVAFALFGFVMFKVKDRKNYGKS